MTSRALPGPLGHTDSWAYTADDEVGPYGFVRVIGRA